MDRKEIRETFVGVAERVETRHLEIVEAHAKWDRHEMSDANALERFHNFAESLRALASIIDACATGIETKAEQATSEKKED